MYWAVLILLNLPVYLLIGWVVFDSKDNASTTIYETVVALLKILFIPKIVRWLFEMDDSGAWGLIEIAAFFLCCAAMTYGEHWLLQKIWNG